MSIADSLRLPSMGPPRPAKDGVVRQQHAPVAARVFEAADDVRKRTIEHGWWASGSTFARRPAGHLEQGGTRVVASRRLGLCQQLASCSGTLS
eukprot:13187960-Alexandrium_andersonii.AAC.1